MKITVTQVVQMLDVFPGAKTYGGSFTLIGMLMCQMFGYHTFSAEEFSLVGITTGVFYKMGQDRKAKEKEEKEKK